ncbi:hypothetical protein [Azospirillum brasilense]|uniref:hypothetical protein n=1 Tax=Azospirillum brasilense TaxID=192 RepID=UPI0018CB2F3C|nr:hypothetical protein [Azospirillum brasilense]
MTILESGLYDIARLFLLPVLLLIWRRWPTACGRWGPSRWRRGNAAAACTARR